MIRRLYAASMIAVLAATSIGLKWTQEGVEFLIDRLKPKADPVDEASEEESA